MSARKPMILNEEDCPKLGLHTRSPSGYIQRHEWAERKAKRHYQIRCPGCGLYRIWKRKPKNALDSWEPQEAFGTEPQGASG